MKEKIKIYIQYPWGISDSSYYKYLTENPPENVEFINKKKTGVLFNYSGFKRNTTIKQTVKKIIRKVFSSMPNAHLTTTKKKYDLIHCAHCISLNKDNWVADIEYDGQLWAAPITKTKYPGKKYVRKIITRKNCKKIIAWTEWVKNNLIEEFPEIKDKIEIVYPAMTVPKIKKKKSDKIILLFISRRFYFKGGLQAVEIMDRLTKKFKNVEAWVVSETPENIKSRYGKNEKIKFINLMPQEKIFKEVYSKSNIMIYPSFVDTFGFAFLEALAFGIPVIGVKGHCNKEIITEGKTGFIIDVNKKYKDKDLNTLKGWEKTIDEIEKKASLLIKNKKTLERMSKNCRKEVTKGKFSIKERNKKLERIYKEAVN